MNKENTDRAKYYRRKKNTAVTAVQLDLETEGFIFIKWGSQQRCRRGDWLINSENDCYTVSESSFKKTYREESPGRYIKHTLVLATKAHVSGTISTQEGETAYAAGDYLIDNAGDGSDCYAIDEQTFHELYELANDHNSEA